MKSPSRANIAVVVLLALTLVDAVQAQTSGRNRERIREYLLSGGMLILNTGMGSKPFFDSALEELNTLFPEIPVQRLTADHPIFHAYYNLEQVEYRRAVREAGYLGNAPWIEGLTINCRTVAVVSRWCMASGWDDVEDESILGYSTESAKQLGVNLMAYATAQRAWAKNAVQAMQFIDDDPQAAGRMFMAQIVYDGEWRTRHAGISVLLQQFNQKTEIPVTFSMRELRLSDPRVFDSPLLYLTGHEDFALNNDEVRGLREYLTNGGFLFAEACCGRRGFAQAFERELRRALPEHALIPIPAHSPVYQLPNRIDRIGVTPALAAHMGNQSTIPPQLRGVEINGNFAVIFSPYGLAGGWEMSQSPYAHGYDDVGALILGENILMYAITY